MCEMLACLRVFLKLTLKKLLDAAGATTACIAAAAAAAAAGATKTALSARLSFVSQVSTEKDRSAGALLLCWALV
jgi:hypothetical protein